jgi:hypothetical protein
MEISGIVVLLTISVAQLVKVLVVDRIEKLEGVRNYAMVIVAVLTAWLLSALPLDSLPTGVIEGVLATGMFSSVMQVFRGN